MTNSPRHIEKTAKKLWRALPHLHVHQELHANEADIRAIKKVLTALSASDAAFHAYVLHKPQSSNIHQIYYNMLASAVRDHTNAYAIYIDKRDTNKKRQIMINTIADAHIFNRVEFVDSRAVKQIQMVDFVSWAVFQQQEFGVRTYTDLIEPFLSITEWSERTN